MKAVKMIAAACLVSLSAIASAEVAVVVNPSVSGSPSQAEVANIFLGKDKSMKGIDQSDWNETKEKFYTTVAKRNESQLKSYWSSLVFTGKGQPLSSVASDAEVKSFVSSTAEGIGYIDSASVDGSVKVLFVLP